MKTIKELQVADYLLKITIRSNQQSTSELPVVARNLKFVVSINGSLWYGDFVKLREQSPYVEEYFVNNYGDQERTISAGNDFFDAIWRNFPNLKPFRFRFNSKLGDVENLRMLFESISETVSELGIKENYTPFKPYLYNACSLDKKVCLPFIDLRDTTIRLVSIIDASK